MRRKLIYLVMVTTSCVLNQEETVDLDNFNFKTTDSSEIFFKNVRQSAYSMEEMKAAKMNVFKLAKLSEAKVRPSIVHHWLVDEASLLLEFDSAISSPVVLIAGPDPVDSITFTGNNRLDHLKTANFLFEAATDSLQVFAADIELLPPGSTERKLFRILMNDYYRLVDLK